MDSEAVVKKALRQKYEILSVLGEGGMATVYKAIQISLGRTVALKVIHQNLVHNEEFIWRFHREADVLASLRHPNIVTVYDYDSVESVHYMAMEYLEGLTLRELLRKKGSFSISDSIKFVGPIADALGYMDSRGIVHRDVKPSNIFITKDKRPVLMDFGVVSSKDLPSFSGGKITIGTPEYMSPEQAEGKIKLDGRSDIFSLGTVLYECLTGKLPFTSDNPYTTLYQIINKTPPTPRQINPQVPDWMSKVVEKCMLKDRDFRYSSGIYLANALNNSDSKGSKKQQDFYYENDAKASNTESYNNYKNNLSDSRIENIQKPDRSVSRKENVEGQYRKAKRKESDKKRNVVLILVATIILLACLIAAILSRASVDVYISPPKSPISQEPLDRDAGLNNTIVHTDMVQLEDIDGNKYRTVQIGNQIWMAENLGTTRFNDGSYITLVEDSLIWASLTSPAYCFYKNDISYKNAFGVLYNWYCVNSLRLCPQGWHVPTAQDWSALMTYLGGNNIAGSKLMDVESHKWVASNLTGTNVAGFNALPGGWRYRDGRFMGINYTGNWWSTTNSVEGASILGVKYNESAVIRNYAYFGCGLSVRCIKD